MELLSVRIYNNKDESFGILSIDNKDECFTLEDQYQNVKVYGETRIPSGKYKVRLRTVGRLHEKYRVRFPKFHKGMLELVDVPGFTNILIHIGNTDDDTLGCILVGRKVVISNNGKFTLEDSTTAYIQLYNKVIENIDNLTIQVI